MFPEFNKIFIISTNRVERKNHKIFVNFDKRDYIFLIKMSHNFFFTYLVQLTADLKVYKKMINFFGEKSKINYWNIRYQWNG